MFFSPFGRSTHVKYLVSKFILIRSSLVRASKWRMGHMRRLGRAYMHCRHGLHTIMSSSSSPSLLERLTGGDDARNMAAPTATPVGGRSFAAPAMIRILLTPATSHVKPDEFERMTSVIRRIETIRLADLPSNSVLAESIRE